VKRLLFDVGSILTALSPLIVAAYFITQGNSEIDAASVIVETSELRPALAEISDAAEEARVTGDTGPLLAVIEELDARRDHAAESVRMVLPSKSAEPLIDELDTALNEFTGSVTSFASSPGEPGTLEAVELRADDAIDEILSTLILETHDSVNDGEIGRERALMLMMLGVATTTAAILLWRRRARRALDRSESASRTIRQMASQTDRAERRIRAMSHYDPLTGVTSRDRFVRELTRAVMQARERHRSVAVIMLDLNRFKLINDTLGHASGDRLLAAVARRLQKQLGKTDTLARFGGDEFVVMITGLKRESTAAGYAAAGVAGRLQQALREPFAHDEREPPISASIGLSVYPSRARDAEELLRQASAALYQAKERGDNAIQFYDPREHNPAKGRLELEAELRRAIEREEFEL
jgi:diguanylate cyclase (GGDEF)-like protein